jgi:hypothetical protein
LDFYIGRTPVGRKGPATVGRKQFFFEKKTKKLLFLNERA